MTNAKKRMRKIRLAINKNKTVRKKKPRDNKINNTLGTEFTSTYDINII